MSAMKVLRSQFTDEIKQKQSATDILIHKILYSKRLLVDHVEALEHCMACVEEQLSPAPATRTRDSTDSPGIKGIAKTVALSEIFTAQNACILLGATVLEYFITPRLLRITLLPSLLVTGSFSAAYIVKSMFGFRNKIVASSLENLIRTIDDFGNCIRRNMTYFNEIIIMKQQELIESRQIERAWDCITAAKEVTEILFEATKKLESEYPIPARFSQYYAPMEDLKSCDYFKTNVTDYSPKHIKDFHNIFAYIQSQYLLRLALSISSKPSLSRLNEEMVKIECLIRQLVLEEENHFKNLAIELNQKKAMEMAELHYNKLMESRNDPVRIMQESSLKLSGCMVAVAGECLALDITLQRLNEAEHYNKDNASNLVQVANNMRGIENSLSACFGDFQRLMLVYNKFLTSKMDWIDSNKNDNNKSNETDEFPESFLRVEISQNNNDEVDTDDFYAYMFDEQQHMAEVEQNQKELNEKHNEIMEILNFEKKLTKGKFRPVLKQLKQRIGPIRKVMLEKEREVLSAKGINVDKLFSKIEEEDGEEEEEEPLPKTDQRASCSENVNDSDSDDESEGSADLEFERRSTRLKEHDHYDEMRNFLAQKEAINLFQINQPPTHALGDEDIIMSDSSL